jgi:hypothetical protein
MNSLGHLIKVDADDVGVNFCTLKGAENTRYN